MRIRRSTAPPPPPPTTTTTSSVSPSSCSSSSSSSCFSSSQHSTISSHSLTSSSNSTSSSSSPSLSNSSSRRCEGLDLLVKAVFHVHSSVIGVPYIQRRVIRRRKPALHFANLVISTSHPHKLDPIFNHHDHLALDVGVVDVDVDVIDDHDDDGVLDCLIQNNDKMKMKTKMKGNTIKKSKKRSKAVPVKYQDSVLESWKSSNRRRRSTKV